jgi:hypothetical protein
MSGKKRAAAGIGEPATATTKEPKPMLTLYHETPVSVKTHFFDLAEQAQVKAAVARSAWRSAIAFRRPADARRFFALAMKHQQIADFFSVEGRHRA